MTNHHQPPCTRNTLTEKRISALLEGKRAHRSPLADAYSLEIEELREDHRRTHFENVKAYEADPHWAELRAYRDSRKK